MTVVTEAQENPKRLPTRIFYVKYRWNDDKGRIKGVRTEFVRSASEVEEVLLAAWKEHDINPAEVEVHELNVDVNDWKERKWEPPSSGGLRYGNDQ
jgi:hypothetical protein